MMEHLVSNYLAAYVLEQKQYLINKFADQSNKQMSLLGNLYTKLVVIFNSRKP
jgi:hypothetical protein